MQRTLLAIILIALTVVCEHGHASSKTGETEQHLKVVEWAMAHGYKINPKLKFDASIDVKTGYLNVFARHMEPLSAKEAFMEAPYDEILNLKTAKMDCHLVITPAGPYGDEFCYLMQNIKAPTAEYQGFEELMGLNLYVTAVLKSGKGNFAEYILNLPKPEQLDLEQISPFYFSNERKHAVFKPYPSFLQRKIELETTVADTYYADLPKYFKEYVSEKEFKFGYYLLTSRVFGVLLYPERKQYTTLIPIADYLNHHVNHNIYMQPDSRTKGTFKFVSEFEYPEKEGEFFGQYGAHTNLEYLLQYAFVLDDNPHDHTYFNLLKWFEDRNVNYEDPLYDEKWQLVRQYSVNEGHVMFKKDGCYPEHGLNVLRLIALSKLQDPSPQEYIQAIAQSAEDNHHDPIPNTVELELRMIDLWQTLIQEKHDEFEMIRKKQPEMFTPILNKLYDLEIEKLSKCIRNIELLKTNAFNEDPSKFEFKGYKKPSRDEL